MSPGEAKRGGVPPRRRLPLLALGFLSLAFGVAGGLARLQPGLAAPGNAIAFHGALMVSAFFGTVISLERAAALDRPWAYLAPLAAGAGGALALVGLPREGFVVMVAGAAIFALCNAIVVKRQPSLETLTLLAGALAWLAGNALLYYGEAPVAWWIAFFALTIAAERLELSRYLKRSPWVRRAFAILAALLLLLAAFPSGQGVLLVLLALWLLAFDLARVTIRQRGLPRYVAACLLPGYAWLGVGGALLALGLARDAALHAIFVGFVFSMVFGHAPVILPAVLRVRFPYRPALYAPLVLLHVSLAARVLGFTVPGAWGNAAAIALFIAVAAFLVLRVDHRQGARARVG